VNLEEARNLIPEPARDIKLNLQAVLAESRLGKVQRWGVAVASAVASRNAILRRPSWRAPAPRSAPPSSTMRWRRPP
jgi:alkyl hydroperoxide reductase subunit D